VPLGVKGWFGPRDFCSEHHRAAFTAEAQPLILAQLRAAHERFAWRLNGSPVELRKVS
jgi:hypothetical protein